MDASSRLSSCSCYYGAGSEAAVFNLLAPGSKWMDSPRSSSDFMGAIGKARCTPWNFTRSVAPSIG
jgi:hypothetical protein